MTTNRSLTGRIVISLALFLLATSRGSANPVFDGRFEAGLWARSAHSGSSAPHRLVVDASDPRASDRNAGTSSSPLRTVGRAVSLAMPGTRIVIRPGIYRETIRLRRSNSGTAREPVVIEAEKTGSVVLSGSDRWVGWVRAEEKGVFSHAWPYRWGVAPDPFGAAAPMRATARRREMVFVDGAPYRQVFSAGSLRPRTFFVSEERGEVRLCAPANVQLSRSHVEVAVRSAAIDMGSLWRDSPGRDGWPEAFVLRGLAFRHYSNPTYGEAAVPAYGRRFLIEDCDIGWNNAAGIALRGEDFIVRRTRVHDNGFLGISIPPTPHPAARRFLIEDCEVARNNWRGAMGGFYGFAVAGVKIMTSRDYVLRRLRSHDNACPGLWLDKENRNALVEGCELVGNRRGPGLWIEISEGPISVRKTLSAFNQSGLLVSNSSDVAVEGCVLYGNDTTQIGEWSPGIDREGFRDVGFTLKDSVIACASDRQRLFQRPAYPEIYATLRSDHNLWWDRGTSGWCIGRERLDFSSWISRTGGDLHSLNVDPRFSKPSALNWTLGIDSPLRIDRRAWGERRVVTAFPLRALAAADTKVYLNAYSGTGTIRYTLDGSPPSPHSPAYTAPIHLSRPGRILARMFGRTPSPFDPVATSTLVGPSSPTPNVFLSDLSPTRNVVGWGGSAPRDRSIQGGPLTVFGVGFERGLGAHADSEIVYPVDPTYRRFVSLVGIDDEAEGQGVKPVVEFTVFADATAIFRSGAVSLREIRPIDVALPPGTKTLRLVAKSRRKDSSWAHCDWIRCGFLSSPEQ